MSVRPSRPTLALLLLFPLAGAGCAREATAPGTPADAPVAPAPTRPLGLVEVTISGIGSPDMHAAAIAPTPHAAPAAVGAGGVSFSLVGPANGGGTGDGSIELVPLSTGSFTDGTRDAGGVRYLWATFRVRNAQQDGAAYDTPRQNLTFFAAATGSTLGGSAISSMERFDGSAADPAIAPQLLPAGAVERALGGGIISRGADVLQVLTASEAAAVTAPTGVTVLPYGFVVRNATDAGRSLPASPDTAQYDGVVTFAFKVPLQASASADPFTITALFLAEDDGETRITQSLEELTPAGEAAFLARAQAIGATMRTVLPGSDDASTASTTRTVCTVPTTTADAPTPGYLVHRAVASVTLDPAAFTWPLWAGGSVGRELGLTVRDSSGTVLTDVPVHFSLGTPGVVTLSSASRAVMMPRRDRASTTVSYTACGITSDANTLRTSGYIPLATGANHTLALESDGTVVGWGDNSAGELNIAGLTNAVQVAAGDKHSVALLSDGTVIAGGDNSAGQLSVPLGLTDVVQVAAGLYHSVALKSDGTVVAWEDNSAGERNIPAGLTNVVQIAAGGFHSLALKSDGTVVGWGDNDSGELNIPAGLTDVVQIATGQYHSLALKSDGTVVGWGDNSAGQLDIPAGLTGVVQIAVGDLHSLALKSDGTVVAWGNNSAGQLDMPAGLKNVVQVAAAFNHSLALEGDGTVVGWGENFLGETIAPAGLVATVP